MKSLDLIVRGGQVVTPAGIEQLEVGIADGTIVALEQNWQGNARKTIEASSLHVFPGMIDAHVHFNDPGRADWEGIETGSQALAAGGGTMFFDMPLNSSPPTIDAASFRVKLDRARASAVTDFAFWGGLVPDNLNDLDELADCGVIGFKAFMCNSGIDDFPSVDGRALRAGMKRAAALKLPVAVHAESESLTQRLTRQAAAAGRKGIRDYLDSRPIEAELEAIRMACDLAGETRCALHVVHVSCGAGVALIAEARTRGVDLTCETCPHYLALTEKDLERLGGVAKCSPPLRTSVEQQQLWEELLAGRVTTIGSDHSPSPPEMKRADDFFKVWGGISGAQHSLPLLLTLRHFERAAGLDLLARLTSTNVAERFRLPPQKGRIALGCDADLALIDLGRTFPVTTEGLLYRHRQSPYIGRTLRGVVVTTLVRGHTAFKSGQTVAKPLGQLVRPFVGV